MHTYKISRWALPNNVIGTGGIQTIVLDQPPLFPEGLDSYKIESTGFEIDDFFLPAELSRFEHFRVLRVQHYATFLNPFGSIQTAINNACVDIWACTDFDDAGLIDAGALLRRSNVKRTVLSAARPTACVLEYSPIRGISSAVNGSLHAMPRSHEWLDVAYSKKLILRGYRMLFSCPMGAVAYIGTPLGQSPTPEKVATWPVVRLHSWIEVEFKGLATESLVTRTYEVPHVPSRETRTDTFVHV